MTKPRDFSIPDEMSDVVLVVEEQKLHVNKAFLSTMSPMFYNMFMKDFKESKQLEVELNGPPGDPLKYDQFLELMKVVHPPHEVIKGEAIEYLLALAHYFQIALVFGRAEDLVYKDRDHRHIPLTKKLVMIDKYGDKLIEAKNLVLSEFKKSVVARDLMKKAEYVKLSAETKAELLQALVDANKFDDEPKLRQGKRHVNYDEWNF